MNFNFNFEMVQCYNNTSRIRLLKLAKMVKNFKPKMTFLCMQIQDSRSKNDGTYLSRITEKERVQWNNKGARKLNCFLKYSPTRVIFSFFLSLIFRSNLPWTVKYIVKTPLEPNRDIKRYFSLPKTLKTMFQNII